MDKLREERKDLTGDKLVFKFADLNRPHAVAQRMIYLKDSISELLHQRVEEILKY